MVKYPGTHNILTAIDEWCKNCLREDGSVFTDEDLWTESNCTELLSRLREDDEEEAQSESGTTLQQRLTDASRPAKKFASEILWVLFLFPSDPIDVAKKRKNIEGIWSQTGDKMPVRSQQFLELLEDGIAEVEESFLRNLIDEFVTFVRLIKKFKSFSKSQRQSLSLQPWQFGNWLDEQASDETFQFRHMLLHLLFPDKFERIASYSRKSHIVELFSGFDEIEFEKSCEDIAGLTQLSDTLRNDIRLFQIRQQIGPLLPEAGDLDFHEPPLNRVLKVYREDPTALEEIDSLLGVIGSPDEEEKTEETEDTPEAPAEPSEEPTVERPQNGAGEVWEPLSTAKPPSRAADQEGSSRNFFWLSADPDRWDQRVEREGEQLFYSFYDESGEPRVQKHAFEKANPGDRVIFYQSEPVERIVATGRVEKGLHDGTDLEGNHVVGVSFRIDEERDGPVLSHLKESNRFHEPKLIVSQAEGNLFEITREEFERFLDEDLSQTDVSKGIQKQGRNQRTMPSDKVEVETAAVQDRISDLGEALGFESYPEHQLSEEGSLDVYWTSRNGRGEYGFEVFSSEDRDTLLVNLIKVLKQEDCPEKIFVVSEPAELEALEEEMNMLKDDFRQTVGYFAAGDLEQAVHAVRDLRSTLQDLGLRDLSIRV